MTERESRPSGTIVLEVCAHCGGEPEVTWDNGVICEHCGVEAPSTSAWNRRPLKPHAREEALEEAAKVAEMRHTRWRMPHPDDAKPGEVCCDVSACEDIASAIRALKSSPLPKGGE